MNKAFNLLDEPWIPVRTREGEVQDVSLLDVLIHAMEYEGLAETSPCNLVALHRLLLAITHRALMTRRGPWRQADLVTWFRDWLPESTLRDYLEHWRERFWLFHEDHPFMQVAALAEAPETCDKLKPWTQVALEGACGNTPVVFNHAIDDMPVAIPCAHACRNLLGFLQFTPGGLVKTFRGSDKAGPLANTAAVLPLGGTLAETLILALHPGSARTAEDLPAWELPPPEIKDLKEEARMSTGPNDRYTRLTRAVLLVHDAGSGTVSRLRYGAGLALAEDAQSPDPMACYRMSKEGNPLRVSFKEGRALWRDLPSLVPDSTGKYDQQPAVLGWSTLLHDALGREELVPVAVAGLASDQAKLLRWRAERVELPVRLLDDPEAAAILRGQLRRTDDFYYRLAEVCAAMLAQTMPDPDHKDTRSRARAVFRGGPGTPAYFSVPERNLPRLMRQIADGETETAHREWSSTLQEAAEVAWETTWRTLGSSPAAIRAEARSYPRFRALLRSLEGPFESTPEEVTT